MALDVSRFPEAVIITPTFQYSEFRKDGGRAHDLGKERDGLKRKRSFVQLFGGKGPSKGGRSDVQHLPRQRVNSFHPCKYPQHSLSVVLSPVERVSIIEASVSTRPQTTDRRTIPKPPRLTIPDILLDTARAQMDMMFPPTPKTTHITTRDTIKALGLSNLLSKKLPKAVHSPPPNPAIFGDGVPTFSTTSLPLTKNDKPLPHIPRHTSPPSPNSRVGMSLPNTSLSSNSPAQPPPQNVSSHAGVGGHPTRGAAPSTRGRGRRNPPPPLFIPPYKHTKSVPWVSPSPQTVRRSHSRKAVRDIPAVSLSGVAESSPTTVVILPPTPPVEVPTTRGPSEGLSNLSVSSVPRKSTSPMLGNGDNQAAVASSRVRGPRGPRIRQKPDPSNPELPPPSRKKAHKGSSPTKGVEKHSAKTKTLPGKAKNAQGETQKQRPFLAPLHLSQDRMALSDLWVAEDMERSAILGNEERSSWTPSQPRSSIGSGYTTLIAPILLGDEVGVMAKGTFSTLREDMDLREVISQLRNMKASPGPMALG